MIFLLEVHLLRSFITNHVLLFGNRIYHPIHVQHHSLGEVLVSRLSETTSEALDGCVDDVAASE